MPQLHLNDLRHCLDWWLVVGSDTNGYSSPCLRGDTDLDHDVDTVDLTGMIVNYTGAIGSGTTWLTGDTDTADLTSGAF